MSKETWYRCDRCREVYTYVSLSSRGEQVCSNCLSPSLDVEDKVMWEKYQQWKRKQASIKAKRGY